MGSPLHRRFLLLPTSLLLFVISQPAPSYTQTTHDASVTMSGPPVSISTLSTRTASSKTKPHSSMHTSFISSTSLNATTSSATSTKTPDPNPGLFPPAGDTSNQHDGQNRRNDSVFNYYFLILAVFGVVVAVFLWWVRRQRKRRKEQMRLSGQNALARDLDGWINTRRWMHGTWRHNQTAGFLRREEGLNEHGEAPPPYQPKSEITVAQSGPDPAQDAATGLSVPMRTLSRDEINTIRPPKYQDTGQHPGTSRIRPETATTGTTRPDTADNHSNISVRDLVRD